MGKEIMSWITWFFLTMIAVLFAMATVNSVGLMKYAYFFISIISCFLIRIISKRGVNNGK
jgi:hypothetical protein